MVKEVRFEGLKHVLVGEADVFQVETDSLRELWILGVVPAVGHQAVPRLKPVGDPCVELLNTPCCLHDV